MPKIPTDETLELPGSVLKKISEAASEAACKAYREEQARVKQENKDRRLYNTRLLMEKYLGLKEYCEDATYDAMRVNEDKELIELIRLMGRDDGDYTLTVDVIRQRAAEVRIIIHHVDKMLDFYRCKCQASHKIEERRRWDVVWFMYLVGDAENVDELAVRFGVDERTVYRYINGALRDLSVLFFGCIE